MTDGIKTMLKLCRDIDDCQPPLTLLGEGSISAKLSAEQFAITPAGKPLGTVKEADLAVCQSSRVLALLDKKSLGDEEMEQHLLEARAEPVGNRPGVEALLHAWLHTLPDVYFAARCPALAAQQVLCSPRARDFAERRLLPEEVLCCGSASLFVPFAESGLVLAREVSERTRVFMEKEGRVPRLILLQNHGLVALGGTAPTVLRCLAMANKAAAVFVGAAAMGGPNFLTPQQVERIAARPASGGGRA